jgi:nitrate reductase gamma subunit
MTGITWYIITFSVLGIFLVLMAARVISMARRPEHLRWELAPVPRDKGKTGYGGSYLEDHEWWRQPRQISRTAPIIYMLREIFTLKSVWQNNRWLWPFSMSLHYGIYLSILAVVFHAVIALMSLGDASVLVIGKFYNVDTLAAFTGGVLGVIGAIGLILKRVFQASLRNYSSFASFFKLTLLLAVFVSALAAIWLGPGYAREMSRFFQSIFTLDNNVTVSLVSSIHILVSYFFLLVLPLTSMVHFITKHFTYYAVRWNDAPLDERLSGKLAGLAAKQPDWAARTAGEGKSWADLAGDNDEKT